MSLTGIGEIATAAASIVKQFFPDKSQEEQDKLTLALEQLHGQIQAESAQSDVDKVEAGSASLFVAGWRPFVGWCCGFGFAISFLGPLVSYIAALCGHVVVFPALDTGTLMTLLMGMLGLGGYRTYEKVNGIKAGH